MRIDEEYLAAFQGPNGSPYDEWWFKALPSDESNGVFHSLRQASA